MDGRAARRSDTVVASCAASSAIVSIPPAIAAVARLPRAHCHLAIDSAVAASAGSPAAAQAPLSFRIYRSRAVLLAPVSEQSALLGFSTPRRWPLYIRIIRDRRKLILEQ